MADKKAVIATRYPSLAVTLWSRRRNVFQNSSYQLQNKLFAVQKGRNRVSVINQVFFRGKFPAEQQQNNNGEVKGTQNLNKLQRYLLHLQIVTSTIEKEIMGAAAIKIQRANQTSSCLPFFPVFFYHFPKFHKITHRNITESGCLLCIIRGAAREEKIQETRVERWRCLSM